ncbi:hypothetical protein, partial [Halomonas sp. ND22Bw]|uniref:hypothetical protein n=1 Tax=Halomonas sp. ND22Bw TaxID=2054178 RepID=UPI001C639735
MLSLEIRDGLSIPRCIQKSGIKLPEFSISRGERGLEAYALPSIYSPAARLMIDGSRYFIVYTYDGGFFSKVEVAAPLLNGIDEGESLNLSLAMVENADGESHLWWYLNGERVQKIGEYY